MDLIKYHATNTYPVLK